MDDYELGQPDIELRMTAQQARDFAEKLADDDFRGDLENPEKAAEMLKEFGITISPEFAKGKISWPDPGEIEEVRSKTRDAPGFRARHDETCFHVIVWFADALARNDE